MKFSLEFLHKSFYSQGNAHIVYNTNFYYFCASADGPKIVRYDLKTERVAGDLKEPQLLE